MIIESWKPLNNNHEFRNIVSLSDNLVKCLMNVNNFVHKLYIRINQKSHTFSTNISIQLNKKEKTILLIFPFVMLNAVLYERSIHSRTRKQTSINANVQIVLLYPSNRTSWVSNKLFLPDRAIWMRKETSSSSA